MQWFCIGPWRKMQSAILKMEEKQLYIQSKRKYFDLDLKMETCVISRLILLPLFCDLGPNLVKVFHEWIVDHERDCNIKTNSTHPRHGSLVERPRSLVHHDLSKIRFCHLGKGTECLLQTPAFYNPFFATWWCKPVIILTLTKRSSRINGLKYQSCKVKEIRKKSRIWGQYSVHRWKVN